MNYAQLPPTNQPQLILRSSGNGQGGAAWGSLIAADFTNFPFAQTKEYAVSGLVTVPSGATGYLPSHQLTLLGVSTMVLYGVAYYSRTAGVTLEITHNGSAVGSPQTWTTTTSWQRDTTSVFPITVADEDYFAPVVTSISGTPDGLAFVFIYEVTL